MLQAVKDGHLITLPGLTEDDINKHLKLTPATAMGHMSQRRQNIPSTSKAQAEKQQPPDKDFGAKTPLMYAVVVDQGQLYTDLTGKFPVLSSKGNSYVMLCYIYDCNYIKVVPMKTRSDSEWVNDKLLPLPQPPVRAHTDERTNPSVQRATQLRRVLARVYAVSIQNQITTTVP
jgi:hypothetical protein